MGMGAMGPLLLERHGAIDNLTMSQLDWFQRHHNEVVVVQHKQRGRNWRWLIWDEDADVNEMKHVRDSY